jgi:hypothetical protein
MAILLKFVDEVAGPIHLHPLHAFSYEVHHEPGDLSGVILSYKLPSYELAREVHYAILYRCYLLASFSLFYFIVCLLDVLCHGSI